MTTPMEVMPHELMIGNYVKCKISNDAGIYTVLAIPNWGIDGIGDGKEPLILIDRCPKELVAISKIKPIPITIDWLKKFRFKLPNKSAWWQLELKFEEMGSDFTLSYCQGLMFVKQHIYDGMGLSQIVDAVNTYEKNVGEKIDDEKFRVVEKYSSVQIIRPLKHVHSLQNLYFALTGTHLTTTA